MSRPVRQSFRFVSIGDAWGMIWSTVSWPSVLPPFMVVKGCVLQRSYFTESASLVEGV